MMHHYFIADFIYMNAKYKIQASDFEHEMEPSKAQM